MLPWKEASRRRPSATDSTRVAIARLASSWLLNFTVAMPENPRSLWTRFTYCTSYPATSSRIMNSSYEYGRFFTISLLGSCMLTPLVSGSTLTFSPSSSSPFSVSMAFFASSSVRNSATITALPLFWSARRRRSQQTWPARARKKRTSRFMASVGTLVTITRKGPPMRSGCSCMGARWAGAGSSPETVSSTEASVASATASSSLRSSSAE
mmetsp:Transcript_22559/g.89232  ORF Transcript_22559/g.89232 Transcript_22559/m.89232 type:complete len:210 (+) Transcript_22559:256-885(+)